MSSDTNELVSRVNLAKNDGNEADRLISDYMPFIKAETAKFLNRPPDKSDDKLQEILDDVWSNNLWMTIFPLEGEYYIDRDKFCSKEQPKNKCSGQCVGCGK